MGCARKLVFSWGGNPGVGSLHRFRDAVEHGWPAPLELEEHSHAGHGGGVGGRRRRTCRSACCAATRGPTWPAHTRVARSSCPFTGRAAGGGAGAPAGRRHRPRAAGRPARQRPALGDHGRAEGGRARLGALDRDRRGGRRRARAAARRRRPPGVGDRRRSPARPAVRSRPTRTATTSATTTSTSPGTRSAATATRS